MRERKIGQLLAEEGYVTTEQVQQAFDIQKTKRERIWNILMDLGYLTETSFLEFLSAIPGIPSIEIMRLEIEKEILELIPGDLAIQLEAVPIGKLGSHLTVAMVCPLDEAGQEELERVTGLKVRPVLCSCSAVHTTLNRYYRKPEEIEVVGEIENGDSTLEGPLKLKRIAKLVEEIEELPTLPEILSVISSIVNDPDSSAEQLARVIATDGALSAKILKFANSPAFGFSRKVSDIKHAIALLGFKETHAIAMSVSFFSYLDGRADFDFKAYWKHSFACAALARAISLNLRSRPTDGAFVSGLLHDVGKVVLAMSMHGKHEKAVDLRETEGMGSVEAEERLLGITHAEVGHLLSDHWLLPPALANAIRYHHTPELDPGEEDHSAVVFLANILCKFDLSQSEWENAIDDRVLQVFKKLGLSERVLHVTLESVADLADDIQVF